MNSIFKKLIIILIVISLGSNSVFAFIKRQKEAPKKDYRLEDINIDWWDNFNDPYLKEYILRAVHNNHDLKVATLKTKEYQQYVKTIFAGQLPSVNIGASYAGIKTPQLDLNGVDFQSSWTNAFVVPMFASYEADIFLKNYDKTKSAKKQLESTRYQEKAAYISLVTSVATTYFNVVKMDKLISVQKEVVKIRRDIYELTKERNKAGLASVFDTTQTDKLYTIARIELTDLEKQRSLALNQLSTLIGESSDNTHCLKRTAFDKIEYKKPVPHCISSDIITERPDLKEVEAKLMGAHIDIRVARKAFLPTIPIIGAIGFTSTSLGSLFNANSFLALIAASAFENIYSGGKRIANLKMKKIIYEELFEKYKQTDLVAIQEVNDALCQIKNDTQKDKDNFKKYNFEKSNYKLIEARNISGITSRLDLIQFKENVYVLERDKTISKTQRLVDYLSLYKAVGAKM